MSDKLLGLLGIARRAGHLLIGFDAAKAALLANKATLLLLTQDCSPKTEKELRYAGQDKRCPIHTIPADKTTLAAALGLQKPVAVVATNDAGFATAMLAHVDTHTKEDVAL